jgi:predicted transglutaminase-like cysteine proteinase
MPISRICRQVKGAATRRRLALLALSLGLAAVAGAPAMAAQLPQPGFLTARKAIKAPSGASDLCRRYSWACSHSGRSALPSADALKLAARLSRNVNHTVHQVTDLRQYGREELWALPTARGGDCEDLALVKKLVLIQAGIAPEHLLMATVLDRQRQSHAVLVLRTAAGDFVLDILTDAVRPWDRTGYSFLAMQNPKRPDRWDAIFAGGIFGPNS